LTRFVSLFPLEGLRGFHSRSGCGLVSRYRNACVTDADGGNEWTAVSRRPTKDTHGVKPFTQLFHIKTMTSASRSSSRDILVHIGIRAAWRIRAVKDSDHLANKSFVFRR
jgi:hypothetical protein